MQSLEFWSADDVAAALTVNDARGAVREAFLRLGRGEVEPPVVAAFHVPGGGFHWKAALWPGPPSRFVGKLNANFPDNPGRGLPTIQGHVAVIDAVDGRLLALLDSGLLTARRTAAATAVAAELLAREGATRLAILGCGVLGTEHLDAMLAIRPIQTVRVADAVPERAHRLAERARARGAIEARVSTIAEAVRDAEIVVACTPATAPILDFGMVARGAFVAGVGADNPHKHELTPRLLAGSTLVVDLLAQAATIGDLHHALAADVMTLEDVHADLGQIVAGLAPGRRSDDEIIVFDSTGMALQDAAVAVRILG